MQNKAKKCVNYCRVSSREQEETGYSLASQEKLLRDYSLNKKMKISKVFSVSESASGRKQREVFETMLLLLKKERVKVIVCEKVDRLTRNLRDAVRVNDWINEDPEREVHFAKENWVLTRDSKSNEKFIWNIRVSVSQYYTDNLSEEVKKGQKEKIAQGWLPTKPPLGYKTVGEKGHKIHVPNPDKAPLVVKMFELYATGDYSLQRLLDTMHSLGLRNDNGNKMFQSRLAVLLADPFYYGKMMWNGTMYPAKQEPIITKELYDTVQNVLHRKDVPKYSKHNYLFKGIMKCAKCGGAITWQMHKGWIYGYCNGYRGCPKKSAVREDVLDKDIIKLLSQMKIKNSRIFEWAKKAVQAGHDSLVESDRVSRKALEEKLRLVESRFVKLYDDKIDGKIDEKFYNNRLENYSQEKEELTEALAREGQADISNFEMKSNLLELSQKAEAIYTQTDDIERKKLLLRFVFAKVELNSNREMVTEYTEAFKIMTNAINKANGSNVLSGIKNSDKKFEPSLFVSTKAKIDPKEADFYKELRR